MESNNKINTNFIYKIKEKKKLLTFLLIFLILLIAGIIYLNYLKADQNNKISEKYITAGLYLSAKDKDKSKAIFKEIVLKKHRFYSLLALNKIIENKLINNNDELIDLFKIVEEIKLEKNQRDLIKLKKALFLLKISKFEDGKKLLNEIISENSKWKELALEISKIN